MSTEQVMNGQRFFNGGLLSKEKVTSAIEAAIKQIDLNMDYFGEQYPTPAAKNGSYSKMANTEWTNGFWTGMLWLAFEYSGNEKYAQAAMKNVHSFKERIDSATNVNHHDLGFLYTPSCVSAYKLVANEEAYEAAIAAAKRLTTRFQVNGGFIQAWGAMGENDNYRLIIDALLNIPLLYWAGEQTNDHSYTKMGDTHYATALRTVIRENGSTYHTYFFDKETGEPIKGATHQGYSDESSWARGQAWAVYGIPLHYHYRKTASDFNEFKKVTNYFLNRLPADNVPYWDLIFGDGDDQPRDSSAGSIAVCGIQEMIKYLPESDPDKLVYKFAAHNILTALIDHYSETGNQVGAPIINHSVYSWHSGKGVDEGNIWGDYFYFEALIRFYKDWNLYW